MKYIIIKCKAWNQCMLLIILGSKRNIVMSILNVKRPRPILHFFRFELNDLTRSGQTPKLGQNLGEDLVFLTCSYCGNKGAGDGHVHTYTCIHLLHITCIMGHQSLKNIYQTFQILWLLCIKWPLYYTFILYNKAFLFVCVKLISLYQNMWYNQNIYETQKIILVLLFNIPAYVENRNACYTLHHEHYLKWVDLDKQCILYNQNHF